MNKFLSLPDTIKGRTIFSKVIPTVNTLKNIFKKLDELNWNYDSLKKWEKPIYKAYFFENISIELEKSNSEERKLLIKKNLLRENSQKFGAHPVCVYLVAYYLTNNSKSDFSNFKDFIFEKGVSLKELSARAIWDVGTNDGKFLDLFDNDLNIIDFDFFINWSDIDEQLNSNNIFEPIQNENHLQFFLNLKEEINLFRGTNSLKWSKFVCGNKYEYPEIFNQNFYRDDLFEFCNSKSTSDILALLAILSWGGMNRNHGKSLLNKPSSILDIVQKLRNNYFSTRKDAFEYIQDKQKIGSLKGLGIGYYTKLICFLAPNLNGYIMDQWLAKSINLIFEKELIHITNNWVSNKNTSLIYEDFCSKIDNLSKMISQSGYKTEEKLFSIGGSKKGKWRQYVIDNYK